MLLLVVHHLVADMRSMQVVLADLAAGYAGAALTPIDAPPARRRAPRRSGYWAETLAGMAGPTLAPLADPRHTLPDSRGAVHRFELAPDTFEALTALGRRSGATPYQTLLATLFVVCGRLSGRWDQVIATATALEPRREDVHLGVNVVPVRTRLAPDRGFVDAVEQVRDAARGAFRHRRVPFGSIVAQAQLPYVVGQRPLTGIEFTLLRPPPGQSPEFLAGRGDGRSGSRTADGVPGGGFAGRPERFGGDLRPGHRGRRPGRGAFRDRRPRPGRGDPAGRRLADGNRRRDRDPDRADSARCRSSIPPPGPGCWPSAARRQSGPRPPRTTPQ